MRALSHHVVSADRVLDRRRPTCVHFLDKTCKHFLSQFLDKTYLNSTANRKAQTDRNVNQPAIQNRHVSFSLISTEGALRRPATYDDQSHPSHPIHKASFILGLGLI